MKELQKEISKLMDETYSKYHSTIDYVANCLKQFGENGVPVVWDDDNYVADAVYDDSECVRYEINAIRTTNKTSPHCPLEVHVVTNNYDECDEWLEISEFDMDTIFGIINNIQFEQSK